jgi:hypothetical protein
MSDYFLIVGVAVGIFALPSFLNALTESRKPSAAVSMAALSLSCIALANVMHPTGYQISEVPTAFIRVVGSFVN